MNNIYLNRAKLTYREIEILELVVYELSSLQIAERLEISIRTVETHRKNILRKTKASSLVGLTKKAIQMGLVKGFMYSDGCSLVLR